MILKETQNFTRGGTTFCLTTSTKASAVAGLKDELYSKLREKGYEDLIHETINANSLSSFVKGKFLKMMIFSPRGLKDLLTYMREI